MARRLAHLLLVAAFGVGLFVADTRRDRVRRAGDAAHGDKRVDQRALSGVSR